MSRKNYYGHAFELSKDDERLEKFKQQRKDWGFDDTETWNLNTTIIKFALPRLKRFKEITFAYPAEFKDMEEWYKTLDKMINAFQVWLDDEYWFKENQDTLGKQVEEGFELFHKYFNALWW